MLPTDRTSPNGHAVIEPAEIESPFLAAMTFSREEPEEESEALPAGQIETPFRSVYYEEEAGDIDSATSEAMAELLAELRDEEFDEALSELANEAAALAETQMVNGGNGYGSNTAQVERLLEQHFAPLEAAVQQLFESAADRMQGQDITRLTEGELDQLLEAGSPALPEPNPAFEFFFGSLKKKLKNIAKGAVKLAKKGVGTLATLGLGPILNKLKALARPLIKRVLQMAINELPAQLQPLAKKLAGKFVSEAPEGQPVSSPAAEVQFEFDQQVAELLFVEPEFEGELTVAEYESQVANTVEDPVNELAEARQRFVQSIQQLREGEDPTPAVENFLPAILPALKLGIKLAGRGRVVNFLKKPVAMLIRKFVGPKYTPMLARAMVDAGLRLLHLEASPEEANLAAAEAVASTVEETVRRVASLPEYVLENEALLEGFTIQAFEAAAAANLPPVLPEQVYQRRPDLRESTGPAGAWVLQPRGKGGSRFYQKYTRVFQNVPLPPHVAVSVKTFGGRPLASFLRDSLGVQPNPGLVARVHVYEAVPGTWLSRIARWERGVPGLNGARHAWRMLHPLTPQAAGMLLGQPALGREMPLDERMDPAAVAPGERFYYLEVPGARPQVTQTNGRPPDLRRSSDIRIDMDFANRKLRAQVYLSEADAQEIAVKLRQGAPASGVLTGLNSLLDTTLRDIFAFGLYSKVKMNHRIAVLWPVSGYALKRLPEAVLERFRHQLMEWLGRGLANFFTSRSQTFVAATQDPADGVTLSISFEGAPGFDQLDRLLLGQAVGSPDTLFSGPAPEAAVQATPGFVHG